jgi:hypothetical protein
MGYRLRIRPAVLGVVACVGVLTPSSGAAQAVCDSGGSGRLRVGLRPAAIDYGIVSAADLDAGQMLVGSMRVRVQPRGRRSRNWVLCVQADRTVFGPGGKSIDDVEWQVAGSPGWQPVSTGGQIVLQGSGNQRVVVRFRVAVGWEDAPGDYSAPLTFLASAL